MWSSIKEKKGLGAKETKEYFQVIREGTFCWYFWRRSWKSLQAGAVIRTFEDCWVDRVTRKTLTIICMIFWLVKGVHCPNLGTASKLTVLRHHQPPLKRPQGVEDQFYDFNVRLRCFCLHTSLSSLTFWALILHQLPSLFLWISAVPLSSFCRLTVTNL